MLQCTETQFHFGNLAIQPSLNVSGVPYIIEPFHIRQNLSTYFNKNEFRKLFQMNECTFQGPKEANGSKHY
jgi:hypothetical protein